jgi:hypothetical protein
MSLPRTPQELAFHTDRHGVLVVPAVFWLSLVVLARYWVMFLLVGVSARRDGGQSAAALADVPVSWLALTGQALVLLVALAAVRRSPTAGRAVRMVWRCAPWLLLITAGRGRGGGVIQGALLSPAVLGVSGSGGASRMTLGILFSAAIPRQSVLKRHF